MKHLSKIISAVLAAVITVCATAITAGAEDGTIGVLSADEPISAHNEIVEELTGRRDGNTKHYRLKDGSVMAVMYSEPVHKEENGRFVDIDNTLVEGQSDYANLNGVYDVRFAKKAKNNKMRSCPKRQLRILHFIFSRPKRYRPP